MPAPSLIFVGGIHGVGKSSFCSKLASALNIQHFSAGELIQRHREVEASADKRVSEVSANQDSLVAAIRAISIRNSSVLLDGHFCVLDFSGEITRIPIQTFEQLSLLAVVVMHDDVQKIQERLHERDGKSYSAGMLTALQDAELAHAQDVCSGIGTELRVLRPDMFFEATEFIARHLTDRPL
jgi:adenylate kinase